MNNAPTCYQLRLKTTFFLTLNFDFLEVLLSPVQANATVIKFELLKCKP